MDNYLQELEKKSIALIREAKAQFKNPAVLYSTGKDSTAAVWLCKKAFFGKIPFPAIHIDTTYQFPEIYQFRDKIAKEWNLNLLIAKNEKALKNGRSPEKGRLECCTQLKTEALKNLIKQRKFDALILAIRRDEHGIRAKERTFCFPKGSIIYGEEVKPIEELVNSDRVFTHLGSAREVKGISKRYHRGLLLSIKTEYNLPLFLTPNHVVLAKVIEKIGKSVHVKNIGFNGTEREVEIPLSTDRIKWIKASSLKAGDWLWMPKLPKKPQDRIKSINFLPLKPLIKEKKGLIEVGRKLAWKSAHKSSPKIRKHLPLTEDMLRVIGYYVADGSSNLKSNQFCFAFNKKETSLMEDTLDVIKRYFGLEGNIREKSKNGVSVAFNSKILTYALCNLCGKGSRNKRLPFFFTLLSPKKLLQLLKGCWLGDGYHEKYSTTSKILAHQIRLSLLRLGIFSSLRYERNQGRYIVQIAGISKERFQQLLGIKPQVKYLGKIKRVREVKGLSSKTGYGKCGSGGFWVKIKKIDVIPYSGYVYDLEIEAHNSYLVNGIAVHNSPRDENFHWNYKDQPAELWDLFVKPSEDFTHMRVHPILHWTEIEVWEYVKQEKLPINPLYFAKNGKRYRSLGCMPCTVPIPSTASTIDEIVEEIRTSKIPERAGRSQDKEKAYMMQKLRALGYM